MNRRSTLNCLASFGIGGLVSTGFPFGIAAAIFMPAFSVCQSSRLGAYQAAFCYYAGASWPIIPAARNFFGASASLVEGIAALREVIERKGLLCAVCIVIAAAISFGRRRPARRWTRAG